MHTQVKGFSAVEALVVLVTVGLLGAGGYVMYHRSHNTMGSVGNKVVHSTAPAGTTQNIDDLTTQDEEDENAIDSAHESSDQSTVESANSAASSIGGAYNESSL